MSNEDLELSMRLCINVTWYLAHCDKANYRQGYSMNEGRQWSGRFKAHRTSTIALGI